MARTLLRPGKIPEAESGMTLLEMSLSILFLAMFFMALLAASMGVNRITRGFSCRLISGDDSAVEPRRGCVGQEDEVIGTDVNALLLEHHHGFRALRDDLLKTDSLDNIVIPQSWLNSPSAGARRTALDDRCLWEKLEPLSLEQVRAHRNYLVVDRSQTDAAQVRLWPRRPYRLPAAPREGSHFWFIRSGHLIGERWNGSFFEPLPGLTGLSDVLFSPPRTQGWGREAVSEQELYEARGSIDSILHAPNQNWGLLNQICLFKGESPVSSLYLLSGERGKDLGEEQGPFFGREEGLSSRQPQPRLLFYKSDRS